MNIIKYFSRIGYIYSNFTEKNIINQVLIPTINIIVKTVFANIIQMNEIYNTITIIHHFITKLTC